MNIGLDRCGVRESEKRTQQLKMHLKMHLQKLEKHANPENVEKYTDQISKFFQVGCSLSIPEQYFKRFAHTWPSIKRI